jgi:hypothetical protein
VSAISIGCGVSGSSIDPKADLVTGHTLPIDGGMLIP